MRDYVEQAKALAQEVTELRHRLHRHPELGDDLPVTQQQVLDALDGLGLEISTGVTCTSVTAVLRGGAASGGPVVLLRADMDALPLQEEADVPYRSERDGIMHACGHDVHTATLVGAAKLLAERREELPGDVVLMFQTGEELLSGALKQIEEGVLDAAGRRVDRAYGLHVFSSVIPSGGWTTKRQTLMAASDKVTLDIVGRGGHGSTPALANDPVPVMAEVILGVQTLIAKKFSAADPVVVNVGVAQAGNACNIIPESCHVEMSVRTFSEGARDRAEQLITQLVEGICAAHGVRAELTYGRGVGPTVNHDEAVDTVERVLGGIVGDRYRPLDQPLGGSEDFSEVLARVPGAFVFYSGVPEGTDAATAPMNHSANAHFDDAVLAEAAAVYAELAHATLEELAGR